MVWISSDGSTTVEPCQCFTCINDPSKGMQNPVYGRLVVCSQCGNKRCPHATHHDNPCTGSNKPGQPGSRYE